MVSAGGAVVALDVVAVDGDAARGGRDEPADDPDQRRLACAIRPEQGEDLAPLDRKIDRLQSLEAAGIGLGQTLNSDDGWHGQVP